MSMGKELDKNLQKKLEEAHKNLQKELNNAQEDRGIRTRKELAEVLRVSTKTITALYRGKFVFGDPKSAGGRQLAGWAEPFTRMALFLKREPNRVLNAFSINPKHPAVSAAVDRVIESEHIGKHHPGLVLDLVVGRILNRGSVRAGILVWPPFTGKEEAVETSWGGKYIRRVIRSMNPKWEVEVVKIKSLKEAIKLVLSDDDDKNLDCCFGLYDTASRRLKGLDFVDVPGLGVKLQVIANKNAKLKWNDILAGPNAGENTLIPIVIEDEVGHLFLEGVCGFPNPEAVDSSDHRYLAERLIERALVEDDASKHVIFAADSATCEGILEQLKRIDWEPKISTEISPEKVKGIRSCFKSIDKDTGQSENVAYGVGIATRANAKEWTKMLSRTQQDELFRNGLVLTARYYLELLQDEAARKILSPLPLEPQLPAYSARLFVRQVQKDCEEATREKLESWFESWLGEAARTDHHHGCHRAPCQTPQG